MRATGAGIVLPIGRPTIVRVALLVVLMPGCDTLPTAVGDLSVGGVADDLSALPTPVDLRAPPRDLPPRSPDFTFWCTHPCPSRTYCNPCKDQCQSCLNYNECLEGLTTCQKGEWCAPFDGGANCEKGCAIDYDCSPYGLPNLCCNHQCANINSDPMNCGWCDQQCPTPDGGVARCVSGRCQ